MATPSDQGRPTQERPKSLSKYIRRASKLLRQRPLNTTSEASDPVPNSPMIASPASQPELTTYAAPLTSNPPLGPSAVERPAEQVTTLRFNTTQATEPKNVQIPRDPARDLRTHTKQQREKAQALFAKYGFQLDGRDWSGSSRDAAGKVDWIERKVRMRVHRECHHCHTSFGSSTVCANCDHLRCKTCPRWPLRRETAVLSHPSEGEKNIERKEDNTTVLDQPMDGIVQTTPEDLIPVLAAEDPTLIVAGAESHKENILSFSEPDDGLASLSIDPVEQTEQLRAKHLNRVHQRRGVDVVYRPPQHRVRRLCHRCNTMFKGRATNCENCGHQRCPNCPRDPAKFDKYTEGLGYPGDVPEPEPMYPALERVWRKPRIRVRYRCHTCSSVFPASNEKICRSCKHSRCDACTREPIKRTPKEHDEEVLRGLEAKFVGLKLLPVQSQNMTNAQPFST